MKAGREKGFNKENKQAMRIAAAMRHPSCPVLVLEFEVDKLARFIASRLNRIHPVYQTQEEVEA